MITWYTQSKDGFASFYCYRKRRHELVRIRLELNRPEVFGDQGQTGAFYFRDRYVGFALSDTLNTKSILQFKIESGTIVHDTYGPMQNNPVPGLYPYDFQSADGDSADSRVHLGNAVVKKEEVKLPDGIDERDLRDIAWVCFARQLDLKLTNRDASEETLAAVIKAAAAEAGELEVAKLGTTTTTRRRPRRKRKKTGGDTTTTRRPRAEKIETDSTEEKDSGLGIPTTTERRKVREKERRTGGVKKKKKPEKDIHDKPARRRRRCTII